MRQTINPVHIAVSAIHTQAALDPEKWATVEVEGDLCLRCGTLLDPAATVTLPSGTFCAGCAEVMGECADCGDSDLSVLRKYGPKFTGRMIALCGSCDDRGE